MSCFIDTSALYSLLASDDENHQRAATQWTQLLNGNDKLYSSNYIALESHALVQRRLGTKALRALEDTLFSLIVTIWVDEAMHKRASRVAVSSGRRDISLVDWTSFEIMRDYNLNKVFAFDEHFDEHGFECWHPETS